MNNWEFTPLQDCSIEVIDGDRGKNYPKQEDFFNKGFCLFLTTKNVREDGFDFSDCQFISERKDRTLRKGKLKRGDIVLTTRGTLGNIGFYDDAVDFQHIRINSGMVIFRCSKDEFDNSFLFLFLKSDVFKGQVKSLQSGSAQPQLPIRDIKGILIPRLALTQQREISAALSCLDRKISNLRQQNETLESIAQTLFKHWFVDFEFPNEDGKPYKSSGGAMVRSDLGDIPVGWKVDSFGNFYNLFSGGTPRTNIDEYWNDNVKWLSGKDVTSHHKGFILSTEKTISSLGVDESSAKLLPQYTTIISARGTVGNYCILSEEMAISQTNFGVIAKNENWLFFGHILISSLIEKLKGEAYGSVFDTITTSNFRRLHILIPEDRLVASFEGLTSRIFKKILLNSKQIQTLTETRDRLLPKLMSGQLRIPE